MHWGSHAASRASHLFTPVWAPGWAQPVHIRTESHCATGKKLGVMAWHQNQVNQPSECHICSHQFGPLVGLKKSTYAQKATAQQAKNWASWPGIKTSSTSIQSVTSVHTSLGLWLGSTRPHTIPHTSAGADFCTSQVLPGRCDSTCTELTHAQQ